MSGLELILNNSTTTGVPGGFNTGRVQNDIGDLCLWSSNLNGIRVTSGNGYVGIGTAATSTYALDVSGNARISGLTTFTSNVGVGKTSPTVALDVSGSAAVSGALTVQGTLYASNVSVLGTTQIINAYETHSSNVVITNYGTGPGLTVTQAETTAQPVAAFYAGIGSANAALLVNNAGQVAIGKNTAAYALDVSGSVTVSGTLTAGNQPFKIITITGTLGAVNSNTSITLPAGVTFSNIIGIFGMANYNGGYRFAVNDSRDPSGWWQVYINANGTFAIYIPTASTNVAGQSYTLSFITSS